MMNRLNRILLIATGIFILSFILYNRVFRYREFHTIFEIARVQKIILYGNLCVLMCTLSLLNAKRLYNYFYPKEPRKIVKKLLILWNDSRNPFHFWSNSLLELDIFIKNSLPMHDEHMSYGDYILGKISKIILKKQFITLIIVYGIIIICQTIVCISLIYDVFMLQKFFYFYKLLWLIIFPIIITYIIYSIRNNVEVNIASLNKVLQFKVISKELYDMNADLSLYTNLTINEWYTVVTSSQANNYICYNTLHPDFLLKRNHINQEYVLNYCVDSLNLFFGVRIFLEKYDHIHTTWMSFFNIVKYLTYSICWGEVAYIIYTVL